MAHDESLDNGWNDRENRPKRHEGHHGGLGDGNDLHYRVYLTCCWIDSLVLNQPTSNSVRVAEESEHKDEEEPEDDPLEYRSLTRHSSCLFRHLVILFYSKVFLSK